MSRSTLTSNEMKRMDVLLALPLDRFRRALTRLSGDELAALETRLAVQRMKHRLARGGFGVERLRSPQELALLARREIALRHEQERRLDALEPTQLVFLGQRRAEWASDVADEQAA